MDRLLLRPSEAAEALGVSRSKAYAMLASGELPAIRIGVSLRVPVDGLRQWLSERQGLQGRAESGAKEFEDRTSA